MTILRVDVPTYLTIYLGAYDKNSLYNQKSTQFMSDLHITNKNVHFVTCVEKLLLVPVLVVRY